jgi:hypothetical protein
LRGDASGITSNNPYEATIETSERRRSEARKVRRAVRGGKQPLNARDKERSVSSSVPVLVLALQNARDERSAVVVVGCLRSKPTVAQPVLLW